MPFNLRSRSFLKELDFTPAEWRFLLELARELKRTKYGGTESPRLRGKNIAFIFEKMSTQMRSAFEVAAYDQGAHVTYLDRSRSQLGHQEPIADTARVLGRFYDGIGYYGFGRDGSGQECVEMLAHYAGVPVWNGLTGEWHPTQALCDMLTVREHTPKHDEEIALAFLGDARSSVGNSLLVAAAMMGMDVRMVAPKERWNTEAVVKEARRIAEGTGARITHTDDVGEGVHGVDFLSTDAWLSLDEPKEAWNERIALLGPYQISMDVIRATGSASVKVMHGLPAFHDHRTRVGREIFEQTGMDALEMTDEVFESPHSIVFDQAENRLHTIKAVLVATLRD
jgi:ornithine carbamoyltransferase